MEDKIAVSFVTSKGITQFSGYYFRIKKEIALLDNFKNYKASLICLVKRDRENANYLKRIRGEITNETCFLSIFSFFKLRKNLRGKQIAHIEGHRAFFNCWLATRLLSNKPKLVFDYHGAGPEENRLLGGNIFSYILVSFWEWLGVTKADSVILVSNSHYKYLIKKYPKIFENVYIIKNFLEDELCKSEIADKTKLREKYELPKDRIILVYSGNLQAWQEPDLIKFIAEKLSVHKDKIAFLILSKDEKAEELGKCNSVILRTANRDEVGEYLSACDVGLLLRKQNVINEVADPTKLAEYLHAGLNLFISGVGDFEPLLRDNPNAGYFYNDLLYPPDGVMDALITFLLKNKQWNFNSHSKKLFEELYSESAALETLHKCYSSLDEQFKGIT